MTVTRGPRRIHIAPQGFEKDRIVEPARDADADKVYLLVEPDETAQGRECREENIQALEEADIVVQEKDSSLFDFSESFSTIVGLIQEHPDDYVSVNISSGSKITAISGTLACMIHGADPYYVKMEEYGDEPIAQDAGDLVDIPTYPLTAPDRDLLCVLNFISDMNEDGQRPKLRELNEFVKEEELSVLEGKESVSDIYHIVRPQIIEPLETKGYLKVHPRGGEKQLQITERGEMALDLFDDVI